ncbi:glycine zipper family protein [Pseudoduganella aquatica]|uniref:glycine zipper family protein n=1 Tax=Pseudoduganella aquatica TaxID=2660641 RepID=UPI001E32F8D6|nr:glycine zipper family protein [Pseudoduganella aquatica]
MNDEHKKAIRTSISACPIWTARAADQIGQMLAQINPANTMMAGISMTAQNSAIKGGFASEVFHAESFNLDAILKNKDVRAFTDNFSNTPLARNDTLHDIVVMKDGQRVLGAQLKYFKDADATQKAFRSTRDGVHQYENSDLFLGPSDQIDGIRTSAQKTVLKNQQTRPGVARAAEKVRDNTCAQLDVDGAQSTPLSKGEAEQLGSGSEAGKDLHEQMQNDYLNKSTLQQSMKAAQAAAIITAVTAGCINSFQYIQQVRNGEISAEQAAHLILKDTVIAAGDAALKAGAATASVSIAARSLPQLFAGSAFKSSLAGGAVAGAAICAVDAVQCLVLFVAGKMSREELETRTGKNLFQTGAAVVGASVGASIGALGGPVGAFIGSLVGGMITSIAMSIALDNHIEKNFRLTLTNTEQVVGSGIAAHDTLQYLQLSQEYYAGFHKSLYLSERHFGQQVKTMQSQSARLKDKINNL